MHEKHEPLSAGTTTAVTPPGGQSAYEPRSWAERNRSLMSTVGAVLVSLIAAASGHLVELLKLVLDYGWKAVLLIGAVGVVASILKLTSGIQDMLKPIVRTLTSLAEHSGKEDAAHKQQLEALQELGLALKRFSLAMDRMERLIQRMYGMSALEEDMTPLEEPTDPLGKRNPSRPPPTPAGGQKP